MKLLANDFLPMHVTTFTVGLGDTHITQPMIKWMDENVSSGRVWVGGHALYFENEQDAIHFTLRWI